MASDPVTLADSGQERVVANVSPDGASARAYASVTRRVPPDAAVPTAARVVRQTLRSMALSDWPAALAGLAAGLDLVGFRLWTGGSCGPDAWARLGGADDTAVAATVVLAATGIAGREAAGVRAGDVAVDGSTATVAGRRLTVPPDARPWLRAQRLVIGDPTRPFLVADSAPVGPHTAYRMLTAGLAQVGLVASVEEAGFSRSPSTRWPLERGWGSRVAWPCRGRRSFRTARVDAAMCSRTGLLWATWRSRTHSGSASRPRRHHSCATTVRFPCSRMAHPMWNSGRGRAFSASPPSVLSARRSAEPGSNRGRLCARPQPRFSRPSSRLSATGSPANQRCGKPGTLCVVTARATVTIDPAGGTLPIASPRAGTRRPMSKLSRRLAKTASRARFRATAASQRLA